MTDVRHIDVGDMHLEFRRFRPEDKEAMLSFARALPEHDLLFIGRDLRSPKVVQAWLQRMEDGRIDSWVARDEAGIKASCAILRDPLSMSPHVGEVRLLVSVNMRGRGLARAMLKEILRVAVQHDLKKLTARMTPDQAGAISLFQRLGFRAEALLKDYVMHSDGQVHDLAIFSLDVQRIAAQLEAAA